MRGIALAALLLGGAVGPASADNIPQVSDSGRVQLPSDVIARLAAPKKPGEMRQKYLRNEDSKASRSAVPAEK